MSLRSLTSAFVGARVEVSVLLDSGLRRLGPYFVQPPDVRCALVLLSTWQEYGEHGEEGDGAIFLAWVKRWLPDDLFTELFGGECPREVATRVILDLLAAGLPPVKPTGEKAHRESIDEVAWDAVLADFRAVYHADPLGEPWPVFLHLVHEMPRIHASGQARSIEWYTSIKTEAGRDAVDRIFRTAYGLSDKPPIPEYPEGKDEAWFDEQMAKIKRIKA